ncbi:MAG: glutamate--cysteine ligase [Clostridia bacterium]|jgi:glutamate--cysteine ligase|nr:glutamate--cysteine ligase [Clostridia bacterium]
MIKMLKEKIIEYFKSGEKEHEQFTIGAEFEHFIVDKRNLKTIAFHEANGIESLLQELSKKGWQENREGEYLIGLNKDGTTITLEPGCQFELSVKNSKTIKKIESVYLDFLKDVFPILEERDQLMLAVGYQPASKIVEIQFNPKERYQYMARYLKDRGKYAHNMMKGTAATQLTIDYAHQDDFRKKFQVAYALSPVMSALFDNSPIFEGEIYQQFCLRRKIWNQCDDQRCVITDIMKKDFGYDDYAEFLMKSPPIFIKDGDGYVYTADKTLAEIYQQRPIDTADIEHAVTMVFPDIRLKKFIEIRMADALPYPLNMAYLAFWKGLLYSQENLDALYEFTMTITQEDISKANEDIIKEGMNTKLGQGTLRDLAKDLFFMASNYINPNEAHYLQPLEAIIFKDIIPKEITKKHLMEYKG